MAITSTTTRVQYAGNDVTTSFTVTFPFFEDSDLLVILTDEDGAQSTLVLDTDYSVTGGDGATGTVVMVTAPETDYTLTIIQNSSATQTLDIGENDRFPSADVEEAIDRNTLIAQRAKDLASRCIRLPEAEMPAGDMELPPAASRANGFAAFDSDGDLIISSGGLDSDLPISAFGETLVQATDAADGRDILNAQGATEDLTALTAPAVDDSVPIYDLSVTTNKKITLENLLKVINGLTSLTAPVPSDLVPLYDSTNAASKKIYLPGLVIGAGRAREFANVGFTVATTTTTDDSIVIGGSAGALSSTNPAHFNAPSTSSSGRVTGLRLTANVTIGLGAAHWGWDTKGNLTDAEIRVYAVNDGSGSIKFAITPKGGLSSIASTDTETSAASVTTAAKILVNTTLEVGTWPCFQIGWFKADRNDTSNQWTVQSAIGDLNVGIPVPSQTEWTSYTPTFTGLGTVSSLSAFWRRMGGSFEVHFAVTAGTTAASLASLTLPTGLIIDSTKAAASNIVGKLSTSASPFSGGIGVFTGTSILLLYFTSDAAAYNAGANGNTWANSTVFSASARGIPIIGWSAN